REERDHGDQERRARHLDLEPVPEERPREPQAEHEVGPEQAPALTAEGNRRELAGQDREREQRDPRRETPVAAREADGESEDGGGEPRTHQEQRRSPSRDGGGEGHRAG